MRILDDMLRRPLWAPIGDGAGTVEADPPAGGSAGDGGDPAPRGGSIRENLERGFADARRAEPEDRGDGRTRSGRFAPGGPRGAEAGEERASPGNAAPPPEAAEGASPATAPAAQAGTPPKGWAKEAQESWAQLPPVVQSAVLKREADMQKGVDELKSRYADLDGALQPHIEAIRRHGHTPAQAVNQLFGWFQALAANPDAAFPALMKSFNWNPAPQEQAPATQPAASAAAGEGDLPPAFKQYVNKLESQITQLQSELGGKVAGLEGTIGSQIQARTAEAVDLWAKDKPHFQEVRGLMAQLLASGAIPLKEGSVDLDRAYDMAVHAHPDTRNQVWTAQQEAAQKAAAEKAAAEKAAQAAHAERGRRASASIAPGAPGSPTPAGRSQPKRQSVRESLMEAIEQVRG